MALAAGRLRHRITIQRPKITQDPATGQTTTRWLDVASDVPAAIEPLSVREFIASQQMQSEISTRIVIRYREGLTAQMRILHVKRGVTQVYNPQGWLADPESGVEYLTAPCSLGVNSG